jgi:hypothetical protein
MQSQVTRLQCLITGMQSRVTRSQCPIAETQSQVIGSQSLISGMQWQATGSQRPIAGMQWPIIRPKRPQKRSKCQFGASIGPKRANSGKKMGGERVRDAIDHFAIPSCVNLNAHPLHSL